MKKIKLISLTKRNIKHTYSKVVVKKNYITSAVLVVAIMLCCATLKATSFSSVISETCAKIYNPINPLFNDEGGIMFTGVTLENVNKNNLKFITPIKCSEITNINGELNYQIDSNIMVIAPEDGIIKEIGVLPNGEKYIEIAHSKNIVSRIENIYIVGVLNGEAVKKGKDIATVKLGSTVKFSIYEDGIKQTNISVVKNEIVWESYQ